MSGNQSVNFKLCQRWYAAFGKKDLGTIMALFTDDVIVTVGAGASSTAAAYTGTYIGSTQVRAFYESRFARNPALIQSADLISVERPRCGLAGPTSEFGDWVIISGEIIDALPNGTPTYKGRFLHVWTIDANQQKISSLVVFLEPSGRLAPDQGTSAGVTP